MTDATDQERNKEIVERLVSEAWTGDNLDLVDELVSEDYIEYAPFGVVRGVEEYKDGIRMFTTAFPDIDLGIEEMIAEGDTVAFRLAVSGTHEGPFMGIEPTGNEVTFEAFDFTRLEEGEVAEEWFTMDTLDVMDQLGAVSPADASQFEE